MGGTAGVIIASVAIEQAHDPFDQRQIGAVGAACEHARDRFWRQHPGVQVRTGATSRQCVVTRIDVVRTTFKWRDLQPARGQRSNQPGGDRRLATATHRRSDNQTRDAHMNTGNSWLFRYSPALHQATRQRVRSPGATDLDPLTLKLPLWVPTACGYRDERRQN